MGAGEHKVPWRSRIHRPVPIAAMKKAAAKLVVSRSKRGYTAQWQRASREYLAMHPLCVRCEAQGIVEVSRVTDHIVPHKGNMALFWDENNWQALCVRCHNEKTANEDGGFGRAMSDAAKGDE